MVKGNCVHIVVALLERLAVPFEIGRHGNLTGAASNQLNRRVHRAHLQGGISGLEAILLGRHVAELPWAVHFIPKAPVLDAVWFLDNVLATQIAPARPTLHIAVFHEVRGSFRRPCAEIDR